MAKEAGFNSSLKNQQGQTGSTGQAWGWEPGAHPQERQVLDQVPSRRRGKAEPPDVKVKSNRFREL